MLQTETMTNPAPSASRLVAIARNTGYLALAETTKPALSFLLILVISRTLGRGGMGAYTIILTFTGLCELIATLGLGSLIVRGIAATPGRLSYYVSGAVGVALLATALVLPVMLIVVHVLHYSTEIAVGIRLLTWSLLVSILQQYALSICEGLQDMRLRAILSVTDTAGRLATGTFMVLHGHGVLGIIQGMILVRVVTTVIAFVVLWRHTGLSINFRAMSQSSVNLAFAGLPFLLMTIASAVFWSVNTLMLSKLTSVENVGIYNAASRITDILKTLLFSYQIALLPMMSASFVRSGHEFRQECNASIKYLVILTIPMAMGVSVLAPRIIYLVFGSQFVSSGPILQVLAWTVCVFSIAMVFARCLIASHNQMLDLYCNVIALAINVGLGWKLIHAYGPIGAATATLISLTAFGAMEYCMVGRTLFRPRVIAPLVRAVVASLLMGIVIAHLRRFPLFVALLVGPIIYALALLCFGTFSEAEVRTMSRFAMRQLRVTASTQDTSVIRHGGEAAR